MIDIVIISVPGVMRKTPQAAPALLKGSVEAAGFTCNTIEVIRQGRLSIGLREADVIEIGLHATA